MENFKFGLKIGEILPDSKRPTKKNLKIAIELQKEVGILEKNLHFSASRPAKSKIDMMKRQKSGKTCSLTKIFWDGEDDAVK